MRRPLSAVLKGIYSIQATKRRNGSIEDASTFQPRGKLIVSERTATVGPARGGGAKSWAQGPYRQIDAPKPA